MGPESLLHCQFYADQRWMLSACTAYSFMVTSFNSVANKMISESTIIYIKDAKLDLSYLMHDLSTERRLTNDNVGRTLTFTQPIILF